MSLIELSGQIEAWERFYEYKTSLICPKRFAGELRAFIDEKAYLDVCQSILAGSEFPLPRKSVISKQFSQKKRIVYTYPEPENTYLKLVTYLMCRKYDGIFTDALYSFRPQRTAKDAVKHFAYMKGIDGMYAYKCDISNYFNSLPVEKLLLKLKNVLSDDEMLYDFLSKLLEQPLVLSQGRQICETKGIMAGTPLSAFYANLYLNELDRSFAERGIPYARYSDDIIVFARSFEEINQYSVEISSYLSEAGLSLNPEKEAYFTPDQGFTFLGFDHCNGITDISTASLEKLKHKMRRKARTLKRWKDRNGLEGEKAAKAFIRIFNRKLFESPSDNELSWSRWYFPLINTAESLKQIDLYAQNLLRYLISSKHTKARFNVRYEDLKRLGYKSLVHEYYLFKCQTC